MIKMVWILTTGFWTLTFPLSTIGTPQSTAESIWCPRLEIPAILNQTGWQKGDSATFTCPTGFWYNGTNPRVCQEDGRWSGVDGQCQELICKDLSKPDHGSLQPNYLRGERPKVKLLCDEGYTNNGSKELVCYENEWIGTPVDCIERARIKCPELEVKEHVLIDYEKYARQLAVNLYCEPGYTFVGNENATCLENGEWTKFFALCTVRNCEQTPEVKNGILALLSASTKVKVEIKCDPSYRIQGPKEIMCLDNGTWTKPGACKLIQCPRLAHIRHGTLHIGGYSYKNTGRLSCNRGFYLAGQSVITCMDTGQWSPRGRCIYVKCPALPAVWHASLHTAGYVYKSTSIIRCDKGYELEGPSKMTCLKTGQWSKPGTCVGDEDQGLSTFITACISVTVTVIILTLIVCGIIYWKYEPDKGPDPLRFLNDVNKSTVKKLLIGANRVKIGPIIGEGHHGLVYSGTLRKKGRAAEVQVALKTLKGGETRSEAEHNEFIQEATIMQDFSHPNVLSLLGIAIIEGQIYVILPYMANGDLKNYLQDKPFDRDLFIKLLLDGAKGMEYLAKMKFVHRDIAARNCMLDGDMNLYISDFGLTRDLHSKDYYSPSDTTKRIPVKWMAPESLEDFQYTIRSDVWSFGVLIWEVFSCGIRPYPLIAGADMLPYLKGGRRLEKPWRCPNALYQLQLACWALDPNHRPTFPTLVMRFEYILSHLDELEKIPDRGSSSGTAAGATGGKPAIVGQPGTGGQPAGSKTKAINTQGVSQASPVGHAPVTVHALVHASAYVQAVSQTPSQGLAAGHVSTPVPLLVPRSRGKLSAGPPSGPKSQDHRSSHGHTHSQGLRPASSYVPCPVPNKAAVSMSVCTSVTTRAPESTAGSVPVVEPQQAPAPVPLPVQAPVPAKRKAELEAERDLELLPLPARRENSSDDSDESKTDI